MAHRIHQVFRHAVFAAGQSSGAIHGKLLHVRAAGALLRELGAVLWLTRFVAGLLLMALHEWLTLIRHDAAHHVSLLRSRNLLMAVLLVHLRIELIVLHFNNSKFESIEYLD